VSILKEIRRHPKGIIKKRHDHMAVCLFSNPSGCNMEQEMNGDQLGDSCFQTEADWSLGYSDKRRDKEMWKIPSHDLVI
jgi:hypothetical protein